MREEKDDKLKIVNSHFIFYVIRNNIQSFVHRRKNHQCTIFTKLKLSYKFFLMKTFPERINGDMNGENIIVICEDCMDVATYRLPVFVSIAPYLDIHLHVSLFLRGFLHFFNPALPEAASLSTFLWRPLPDFLRVLL